MQTRISVTTRLSKLLHFDFFFFNDIPNKEHKMTQFYDVKLIKGIKNVNLVGQIWPLKFWFARPVSSSPCHVHVIKANHKGGALVTSAKQDAAAQARFIPTASLIKMSIKFEFLKKNVYVLIGPTNCRTFAVCH